MKKKFTLLSVMLLFVSMAFSQVTLPHYEGFDYTIGSALQTQSGWAAVNTGDDILIGTGNLWVNGLQTTTGNKITFAEGGIDASKLITSQNSGTVYYSFLMKVTALSSLNATGGYFTGFGQNATTFGATVWTGLDGTGYKIGINPRTSTTTNMVWATGTHAINETVFVVVSYTFNAAAADDVVNIWVNPASSDFGIGTAPTPSATATNLTGTDLTSIIQFFIRQDSNTETPFVEMDECRIGLSWADVTPVGPIFSLEWCNINSPANGTITEGGAFDVYGAVHVHGLTEANGQGSDVFSWVGYSTSNTDPSGWTNWVAASYNNDLDTNDVYTANVATGLTAGTYYYATRFQLFGGAYSYGGYNGGFWDGTTNVNGVLTVNIPVVYSPEISNITITPSAPTVADAVTVTADASDLDGDLSTVTMKWGTATGVYGNTVTMTLGTGTTYTADSNIPAQTGGTTVFYVIEAVDAAAHTTTSTEQFYTVPVPPTEVATIAALRAGLTNGTVYTLTGEAVLTFQQTNRNQKWVQDATGGILIDDLAGIITTTYAQYDGITGITGTLYLYNGLLEFIPTGDPGTASSTGNTVTPVVVDIATLLANVADYESELVKVNEASFDAANGSAVFATGTNYDLTDASSTFKFRTNYYGADYIGTIIPSVDVDVTGLVGQYLGTAQITSRNLADIVTSVAIEDLSKGIRIYPNPSNGVFNISVDSHMTLEVLDITGKLMNTQLLKGASNMQINQAGIYFLRFSNEEGTSTQKVIVQ